MAKPIRKPYYRLQEIIAWEFDQATATYRERLACGHRGYAVKSLPERDNGKRGCVGCDSEIGEPVA